MDFMTELNLNEDASLMQAWVKEYSHSNSMPIGDYLNTWYEQKSKMLLPMFQNQLFYREKISYTSSSSELCTNVNEWLVASEHSFVLDTICRWANKIFFNDKDYWHIRDLPDSDARWHMYNFIETAAYSYSLADNCVKYPSANNVSWQCPYLNRTVSFSSGQKPFRVYNNFLKLYADVLVQRFDVLQQEIDSVLRSIEQLRLEHSRIFNNVTTSGHLCISIHPMDYMTMSDNGYNWSSCMSWRESGCYHAGTLEMMNSPCVVVAYLEGSKPWTPIAGQKSWSNKKWRELFIVDHDFISGIKGYPYDNSFLEDIVIDRLKKMAKDAFGWEYQTEVVRSREGIMVIDDKNIVLQTHLMYNDTESNIFRYCSAIEPNYNQVLQYGTYARHYGEFCYSGVAYCTVCGDVIRDEGGTLCDDCSDITTCPECGERTHIDYCLMHDGVYYCEDCYNRMFEACEECGKSLDRDEIIPLYYMEENKEFPQRYADFCSYLQDNSKSSAVRRYPMVPYGSYYVESICNDCLEKALNNGEILRTTDQYDDSIYIITDKHPRWRNYTASEFQMPDIERWKQYKDWQKNFPVVSMHDPVFEREFKVMF